MIAARLRFTVKDTYKRRNRLHLSRDMTKPTKWHVRQAKTQISLGIRPVWSESSLSAWRKLGSLATYWVHSEDSDQMGRMPRLIWVFAGHTVTLLVLSCRLFNELLSNFFTFITENDCLVMNLRMLWSGQALQNYVHPTEGSQGTYCFWCKSYQRSHLRSFLSALSAEPVGGFWPNWHRLVIGMGERSG